MVWNYLANILQIEIKYPQALHKIQLATLINQLYKCITNTVLHYANLPDEK